MILSDDQVTTDEVKNWQGLHLLHFSGSACSQKVRILLREKGLRYVSHPINLARGEHTTPWYLGINPRGVVPVLVHDGTVHIESNDILSYLDGLPSDAESFFPHTEDERREVDASLALENELHFALREVTMGFIVPKFLAQKPDNVLQKYRRNGAPDAFRDKEIAWWTAYAEQGVTRAQGREAARAFCEAFEKLEAKLGQNEWMIGDRLSVLELAWFISISRLVVAGYPLHRHPRLNALYLKLADRPAFVEETKMPALLTKFVGPLTRLGQFVGRKRLVDVAGDLLL